ncbi:hypothetical protein DAPPUDRAFT_241345 [Daphnia pulex]|uniref:C1q domain-containing protein n=1 Tax=Daphnia pulex TaxID=6669 RepID=E9GE16_DAPPU|nr:hypothetical protein DAPPUDRAFT_241345 [Daphnia pulex]|eukprot:EFX82394.1 hypothetical protein DAPPUDRAFT_241345 [Daphnia pulex]
MVRRLIIFQVAVLLLAWSTCSTAAAINLEDKLQQLTDTFTRFKEEMEGKQPRLQAEVSELKAKVTGLEAQLHRQESIVTSLQNPTPFVPKSVNEIQSKLINGMPSSCVDLRLIGHIWSGLYSVMGVNMVETVYCNFSKAIEDPGLQKWIGYTDVKSVPVYFYVQKGTNFNLTNTPIPFERVMNNVGNAMNIDTGIFTAPVTGTYFFAVSGMVVFPFTDAPTTRREIGLALYSNGNEIGLALSDEVGTTEQFGTYDMESTLNLKSGDQVWLAIKYKSADTYVFDNFQHHNHFTGWLLQQDFVNSV